MTKTLDFQSVSLGHSVIRYSNLPFDSFDLESLDRFARDGEPVEPFRNSYFDIGVLPEHDFSFRHYIAEKPLIALTKEQVCLIFIEREAANVKDLYEITMLQSICDEQIIR